MHGDQRRHAYAFGEQLAHAVAGRFGRDHGNIDVGGRLDLAEVDVESVGEHQRFAGGQMRGDVLVIQVALDMIGDQDHDHIGGFGGFGSVEATLRPAASALARDLLLGIEPDHHVDAGIAQVQGVRVTLAAIADDCDGSAFE